METLTREEIVEQRIMDFRSVFTSEAGMRVTDYLSRFCLEKTSTFVIDSERKSAFNEGARSVILEIRHWLELDTNKLIKETKNE